MCENNGSSDWSIFPESLHPMGDAVIPRNHKCALPISTNHRSPPRLGELFARDSGGCHISFYGFLPERAEPQEELLTNRRHTSTGWADSEWKKRHFPIIMFLFSVKIVSSRQLFGQDELGLHCGTWCRTSHFY